MYPFIKYIHVTAVSLSLAGFVLRNGWRWRAPHRLRHPLVRTLPHLIDTLLLASGAAMLWHFRWSPLEHEWLMTKLAALACYILLGGMALRGSTPRVRRWAFLAAVMVFMYMVWVALTKQTHPIDELL